jgi:hypothetical protein
MTFIETTLAEFQANGISQAQIERSLDLPINTLDVSNLINDPEIIALLNIIKTYPWLIDVAQKNYDHLESKRILLHNAVDTLINKGTTHD